MHATSVDSDVDIDVIFKLSIFLVAEKRKAAPERMILENLNKSVTSTAILKDKVAV